METFLAERLEDGEGMPSFVVKELRSFLKCGVLESASSTCAAIYFARRSLTEGCASCLAARWHSS
jgi:hypothetical protein